MSTLERKPGRVIFTRPGQTPVLHEGLYYTFLLATAACSIAMLLIEPFYAALLSMLFAVGAMALGIMTSVSRNALGGRLLAVRRSFELVTPQSSDGYRDAPSEPELWIEGRRFPQNKVREIRLGHFITDGGGGMTHDFWPVFLVLDEVVVELAVLRDKADALKLRREIAELFDVPMTESDTGRFGAGYGLGLLNGLLMCVVDLAAVMLPFLLVLSHPSLAVPSPALAALLMWLVHRVSPKLFGARIRAEIDEGVARRFELGAAKVRVEKTKTGRSFQDVADELRSQREANADAEAEAEAEAEADADAEAEA